MTIARQMRISPLNRGRQFICAVRVSDVAGVDRYLRDHLENDEQVRLVSRLPAYDRAHHAAVHRRLVENGYRDRDLLLAALMHDVGKADERGRVRLVHRIGRVLVRRLAPGAFTALATRVEGYPALHGFYLAEHHPVLGAELARRAGASSESCRLIRQHEAASSKDPLLSALVRADEQVS